MPTLDEWKLLIEAEIAVSLVPLIALTDRGIVFDSDSAPAVFGCSDRCDYVVKSVRNPGYHFRVLTNDRMMGVLAAEVGAPVPPVALVDVPKMLVDAVNAANRNPHRKPMLPGLAHGSLYQTDISKRREVFRDVDRPHNRARFALLAMLYGIAFVAGDHQFFYRDSDAAVVSVDHGHFFPGGPAWTIASLKLSPIAVPDQVICRNCSLTNDELKAAAASLAKVTEAVIVKAVAAPPGSWNFTMDERVEMAAYLEMRRIQILTAINP